LRNHIAAERRAAAAEGRAEGVAEGEARGRAEGEARGRAEGRAEGEARGVVAMCKEFGLTAAAAAAKVAERLGIGLPEAEALTKTLW
jgi:flagellar biosynthesis/type III secretory pathway protein FliH